MNSYSFDHVDLRVSCFAEDRKFYDVFLPALGFPEIRAAESEVCYHPEGDRKMVPFIGLNEEPNHRGNANRIAFRADSEEEVDRLGAIVRQAGAQQVEGPEYCHDYTPGYYAVFFEDADGFERGHLLEVVAVVAASTITNYAGKISNPPLEALLQEHAWRG